MYSHFALLHNFKRLAVRWERRTELHDAFVSLACSLICWRRASEAQERLTGVRAGQGPDGLLQNVGTLRIYGEAGR